MMKNVRIITGHILLVAALLVGGLALAADVKKPVGKVSIEEKQFRTDLGGSTGGGMLTFRQEIPVQSSGLSAGLDVGVSR